MSRAPENLNEGRYRIERVLGVGGMSVVLLAFDNRMKVQRAIKLLHKRFSRNPQVRERFENEAYAQAALRHQNILMVHDVVDEDLGVYLVMELAEGGSLADKIKATGPLSPHEVAEIGITMCRALGVAHAEGVIHRDIKPENVLVDRHGVLKIADFGIARVVASHANLTQTGMVMGTWAYMPPEQRESARQADGRADIYALGASLYYLLTGKQPSALHNTETHSKAYEGFPPELARAIQKATRLYPEDRYQTCQELADDLSEILDELNTERIMDFEPPTEPPSTIAPALDDLSTYIHAHPDVAETLAPFLDIASGGSETAVPGATMNPPSLYLPPPDARQGQAAAAEAASEDAVAAPVIDPSASAAPAIGTHPPSLAARPTVTGSQLLIFVLGILAAVIAIAVLLPRLINPPAGDPAPDPALEALAVSVEPPATAQETAGTGLDDGGTGLDDGDNDGDNDGDSDNDNDNDNDNDSDTDAVETTGSTAATPAPTRTTSSSTATGGTGADRSGSNQPRIITIAPTTTVAGTTTPTAAGTDPGTALPLDPTGVVVVRTVPSGATVKEDGRLLSRSGRGYVLPIGSHVLEISSPSGERTRIPVDVRRDQSVEICYSFDTNSACGDP